MSAQDERRPRLQPSFSRDVAPILGRSCLSCHGPAQQMSLLDLSTRAAALKGGQKSGPAIVPGDSAKSPLYRRLTGQDQPAMPLGAQAQRRRDPDHQGLDRLRRRFGKAQYRLSLSALGSATGTRREEVHRPGPRLVGIPPAGPSPVPAVREPMERKPDRRVS